MTVSDKLSRTRLLSVIAATIISLACGTNYVYSAWGPQFAQRLKLSATESNLIGTMGNFGMYVTGIPLGMLIDRTGPRVGVALGVIFFCLGYYPLAKAFDAGPGGVHIAALCLFSFFTGTGSNSAFLASIKVAALNFPDSRGSATAFPVAAFGLSAFFFATLALVFPNDTTHFLLLLAGGTVLLPIISFPFIRVVESHGYQSVSQGQTHRLHRRKSVDHEAELRLGQPDTGAQSNSDHTLSAATTDQGYDSDASSLSDTSSAAMAENEAQKSTESDGSVSHLDIRGLALLRHVEFWQLFSMLGLLTGIGLMTINNIGNDATALWKHYDPTTESAFIVKRQVMHVSILSVCSFSGRLLSGIGSDILVNKLGQSRFWCLLASASGFCIAQILAILISNPSLLVLVSGVTGLSYGMLFGVYPSITAHAFGVHGLSQNWGTITLAPVVAGNVFNLLYGAIYDGHSVVDENGDRQCTQGKLCYQSAYVVTLFAAVAGVALCLWSIKHESRAHDITRRKSNHARIA